jgi:hypothetical protein
MSDRLKQIWDRFETKTTRDLTGSGVDNIPRPDTEEMQRHRTFLESAHEAAAVPMPEGVTEPAKAAFDNLRNRLTSFDEKGRPEKTNAQYKVPVSPDDQLVRDLKETEKLTVRREMDYLSYSIKMKAEAEGRKKRKKFLGIF